MTRDDHPWCHRLGRYGREVGHIGTAHPAPKGSLPNMFCFGAWFCRRKRSIDLPQLAVMANVFGTTNNG